jgi:DNA repair protein RadA/Sms
LEAAEIEAPRVLVIDSIQTLYSDSLADAPGTVSQLPRVRGPPNQNWSV